MAPHAGRTAVRRCKSAWGGSSPSCFSEPGQIEGVNKKLNIDHREVGYATTATAAAVRVLSSFSRLLERKRQQAAQAAVCSREQTPAAGRYRPSLLTKKESVALDHTHTIYELFRARQSVSRKKPFVRLRLPYGSFSSMCWLLSYLRAEGSLGAGISCGGFGHLDRVLGDGCVVQKCCCSCGSG